MPPADGNTSDGRKKIIEDLVEKMRQARAEWTQYDQEAKELLATAAATMATSDGTVAVRKTRALVESSNRALAKYLEAVKELRAAVQQHRP